MKLLKHTLILVGLVLLSISLLLWDNIETRKSEFNIDLFKVDTAQIQSLRIARGGNSLEITNEQGWLINKRYDVDRTVISILNAILSRVEVVRAVSRLNFEEIKQDLLKNGSKVEIITADETRVFYAGGNVTKTVAYFGNAQLDEIYVVGIPGYNNYLSGIFELTANQWRDRVLFGSSWRSIQTLTIDYTNSNRNDLTISFENRALKIEGVHLMDSTMFLEYINQFDEFVLNDYLDSGQFAAYDSLSKTPASALLTLNDINPQHSKELRFYEPLPGERFVLVVDSGEQMIVIDKKRAGNILKSPSDFEDQP